MNRRDKDSRRDRSRSRSRDRDDNSYRGGGRNHEGRDRRCHSQYHQQSVYRNGYEFDRSRIIQNSEGDSGFGRYQGEKASVTVTTHTHQFSTSQADSPRASTSIKTPGDKVESSSVRQAEIEDEDAEMMRIMGFGGFSSSKGTHVSDNDKAAAGIARVKKPHQYRQYMNRRGGFNQSLADTK